MRHQILITGSCGLVGSALRSALEARGIDVIGLDTQATGADAGDVRDVERVRAAVAHCHGVIHLAAVSRVLWGERDPELCWATNVAGLCNVIDSARRRTNPAWLIFASSREVYGQPEVLPASEDTPLCPVNVYGRSKVEGERLVEAARREGLRGAIIRLSNVYGSTRDHADRVVPAFARMAVLSRPLRVDGAEHTFDFTHIDDVTRGIVGLVDHLASGADAPPPIHFVSGQPTTLGQLAALSIDLAGTRSAIQHAPPRTFDVSRFYGCPDRARDLLGWQPRVTLREGLARLIRDFRPELGTAHSQEVAS
ncbi:NAD-dependent epimerase/dehydratase family protein [Polyangium jinanense]|uniref:NAD-dependent epimerase/dehydratase family protein n=1 Tax=Polyangium jinanense TaxID=2829994 RepID=UPI002340D06E|nr:NAD-dependent epimerase/dehydratase family protein [Polyangium jinanense]MDC3956927.1 NAD-dependent epimerase/dehydratase family protein [Polyangium jinanense]